jgi:hypothetical protein
MFGSISKDRSAGCREAQAIALGEMVEMFEANPCEVHDLCVGEEFLARFNRDPVSMCPQTWSNLHSQEFGLRKGSSHS